MRARTMILCAGLSLLVLSGCKKKQEQAAVMPPTQVRAVAAKVQPVTETLSLVGTIVANEWVEIKSETDGNVLEVKFEEGQKVEKGQLLIQLDESKLAATLAESEANFKLSQASLNRTRQLFEDKVISQQERDQAVATFEVNQATLELRRQQLKDTKIFAPFSGVTGSRLVSPGQVISKNTMLTSLVDIDPVKVEINVPERFLSQVVEGQKIDLRVDAFPNKTFQGEVYFVAPNLDRATRTAQIKAKVKNPDRQLRPGMFANLTLTLKIKENAVVIPETALIYSADKILVFVVSPEKKAEMRPVKIGVALPGFIEILSGVKPGEMVVFEGTQKVRPGGAVVVKE